MADWSKPSLTDAYANFLKYLNNRLTDVATQFSTGTPTNQPDQTIRWNPTNTQWEQYSLSANSWTQLALSGVNFPSVLLAADPVLPLQASTKQYVDSLKTFITAAQNAANAAMPRATGGIFNGNIGIDLTASNAAIVLTMNTVKNYTRAQGAYTSGTLRWLWGASGDAENGGNTGSAWFISRYNDAGTFVDNPIYINRTNGVINLSQRPTFGAAAYIPWDSGNLPSPLSATGGQITNGDLNLFQNTNNGGDLGRLVMTNGATGLTWRMRLNGTTGALEYINSAYNAVNASFFDNGNVTFRGSLTLSGGLTVYGVSYWAGNWFYDLNSAPRLLLAPGDLVYVRGAGGSGNYSFGGQRNDGAFMGIFHGTGDFYYASQGWLTGIINGKAPAGVWHHNATVANCGSGTAIALSTSGNTLQLTLSNTNCNCNCSNCSCFPAGSMVLMADGGELPIEKVREGDLVMGPHGVVTIEGVDRPTLGNRMLMTMEDESLQWSDEHLLWARRQGKEWWWGANPARWRLEAQAGHVGGLFEDQSIMEGWFGTEFAHLEGWRSNDVQPVANPDPYTQLYLPYTDGSPIFVNGYMVGARVNQHGFDYDNIWWDMDLPTLQKELNHARQSD